jgi:hypothetical protein
MSERDWIATMPQRTRYQTGHQNLVRRIDSRWSWGTCARKANSGAALVGIAGLGGTTLSSLVGDLIERRFVREMGLESAGTG